MSTCCYHPNMSATIKAESTREQVRELFPEEHRAFVDELLIRYGITAYGDERAKPPGQLNISPKGYEPLLDVAFSHRIRLIASALGPAPTDLVSGRTTTTFWSLRWPAAPGTHGGMPSPASI